ncbi:arginine N-methyltransferase 2 [Magnaporthiopsis poae ATCC 64411]|uniref:Arginine N-methyltransferase 2 n=1 Tax=Magnaporthiopsis poae (strain ATCC 64411 / 73-15) TaxID=644358 RepID=A0A0C4DUR1_MAGP6|nr:arginine N-methyltransferase 2 [Magnaporthiopsis poae ATCC 64411]
MTTTDAPASGADPSSSRISLNCPDETAQILRAAAAHDLRLFFTDLVPGLLDQHGRFGFFNGLGADRQVCYDVYTRVVDMHLSEAGMDVDWISVDIDMERMREAGAGEWEGVKRRYWTLDKYQLPVCTFLG